VELKSKPHSGGLGIVHGCWSSWPVTWSRPTRGSDFSCWPIVLQKHLKKNTVNHYGVMVY